VGGETSGVATVRYLMTSGAGGGKRSKQDCQASWEWGGEVRGPTEEKRGRGEQSRSGAAYSARTQEKG